ncbi:MAG TPA: O-antigen ligase family protein, partial [Thermomicrobiales bacterium]|nr:O-antigen ligase family protein [Thermomicrobiales bacterium]
MTVGLPIDPARGWAVLLAVGTFGVLVLLPFPESCFAVAVAAGIVVAWRSPATMLGLLAASIPVQAEGSFHIAGLPFTWTRAALLCLVIGWLLARERQPVRIDPIAWGYIAILLFLGTSILASPAVGGWAGEIYRWLAATVVYIIARTILRSRSDVVTAISGIALGVIGICLVGFYQVITVTGPPSFVVDGILRAYGSFGEPNPFAAYLELSVLLLIGAFAATQRGWADTSRHTRVLIGTGIVLGMAMLFLTQSRGGWIGFAAGLLTLGLVLDRRQRWAAAGVGVVLACLVLVSPVGSKVTDRFASLTSSADVQVTSANWANQERRAHWGAAISMMKANPWTGIGAGAFNDRYREYTPVWRFRIGRGHAHDGFLQLAAEAGIPGLLAFSSWFLAMLVTLGRTLRRMRGDRSCAPLLVAGLATVVAFGVHSLVDYLNVLSLGIELSIVVAVVLAAGEISFRDRRPTNP